MKMTLAILASAALALFVVAQYERRLIGQRTRDGLAAKRAAGVQLGRRSTLPVHVAERIVEDRAAGQTLRAIADQLTTEGIATGQAGVRWYASSVRAVLASQARRADQLALATAGI